MAASGSKRQEAGSSRTQPWRAKMALHPRFASWGFIMLGAWTQDSSPFAGGAIGQFTSLLALAPRHADTDTDSCSCRGPEIESWFGVPPGTDPAADNDWSFLPFMALSDGAHTYVRFLTPVHFLYCLALPSPPPFSGSQLLLPQ